MPTFKATFTGSALEELTELAKSTDQTQTEVVRDSVTLYWWIAHQMSQGNSLLVEAGWEDRVTKPIFTNFERLRPPVEATRLRKVVAVLSKILP